MKAGAYLFITILALLLPCSGWAQPRYLPFGHLSQYDGLLQQDNLYIYHDSRGYVWISSVSGLNRYNGIEVKTFTPNTADPCAIKGHNITSPFFEDNKSNIWFSTYEGLHCWDRKRDCFLYYPLQNDTGEDIVADNLLFARDKTGVLWLLVGYQSIYTYNPNYPQQKKIADIKSNHCFPGYENGALRYIFFHDLKENQLAVYRLSGAKIVEKKHFSAKQLHIEEKDLEIKSVWYDGEDIVWLATKSGLVKTHLKDPAKNRFFKIPSPHNGDPGIFSIHRLSDHQLLIGSFTSGLYIFNDSISKFTHCYKTNKQGNRGLTGNEIRNVYQDPHGNIWLALFRGEINFTNIEKNKFELLYTKNEIPITSDNMNVTRLLEDKRGVIWVGTQNDGIFAIRPNKIKQFKETDVEEVFQLFLDRQGTVWGIKGSGLLGYYHIRKDKWISVNDQSAFPLNIIYSGIRTSSGDLLVGSYLGGLYQATVEHDKLSAVKIDTHTQSKIYTYLFESKDQNLYACLNWEQIEVFKKQKGIWVLQHTLDIKGIVNSIMESNKGDTIYIATSFGLVCLAPSTKKFKTITIADGLPDQNIQAILEDDRGVIWFSTKRGIVQYTPKSGQIRAFVLSDGLQGLEFMPAACRLKDGSFLFGGVHGVNRFAPEKMKFNTTPPPIEITNIQINDTIWRRPVCSATSACNVNELKSIRLKYNENTIALSFVGIDYRDARRVTYRYFMEHYDNPGDTTHAGNSGFAKYTKLPNGEYVFHIFATNADGTGTNHRALRIEVLPPFWKTWWFYTLEGIALLCLLWGGIRLYINAQLRKVRIQQEKQAALQRERDRIASEMHDDLGAGLSTIRLMSERVQYGLTDPAKKEQISRIAQNASDLIEKMATIIWAMNSSHDTVEGLFGYLRRYASEYLDTHDIPHRFPVPPQLPSHTLAGDKRRHIFLAFKEALHNIVKHAQAQSVEIALQCNESELQLSIADDGIGIPEEKKLGNGLGNMAKRMTLIGGSCRWENNTPSGTIVHFTIPLERLS